MFVNLQTTVISELLKADAHTKVECRDDRISTMPRAQVAIQKLAEAVRWFVENHTSHADSVTAEFYQHALTQVDFASLARALVETVEDPNVSVGRTCRIQTEESATV